jgi:hypothetical protein
LKSPAQKAVKPDYAFVELEYNADVISFDRIKPTAKWPRVALIGGNLCRLKLSAKALNLKPALPLTAIRTRLFAKVRKLNCLPAIIIVCIFSLLPMMTQLTFSKLVRRKHLWAFSAGLVSSAVVQPCIRQRLRRRRTQSEFTLKSITPAYIKRDTIAWFGKHRHTQTANDAYKFTYMFKYALDVPAGATTVTLPNNDKNKDFCNDCREQSKRCD